MADLEKLKEELQQTHDELKLKIHLGSMEAKQGWEKLQADWSTFVEKAQLEKTSDQVDAAAEDLGKELKKGYE